MNNNFTFNYRKQLEEEEQKEIIRKKIAENQKVIKEEPKEPKKKNNRKYIIYIAIAVVIILYALLSSSSFSSYVPSNNIGTENDNNEVENNTSNQEENTINKDIFTILSGNNYTYSNKVTITKEDTSEYIYKGEKKDNTIFIIKSINNEEKEYVYKDEKYFYGEDEVLEEEIYDIVNKQYIDLNYIKDYVEHSSLYATTIYKTGQIQKVYHLPLKEIIIGYQENTYITIEIDQKDTENYLLHIDYTNIVSLLDEEITSYVVDMEYKIIKDETVTP